MLAAGLPDTKLCGAAAVGGGVLAIVGNGAAAPPVLAALAFGGYELVRAVRDQESRSR